MGKIITLANQKGGTGKTTSVLCIGAQLESRGYKVLYVDLDKQCNTSKSLKADIDRQGSFEAITQRKPANELVQITGLNAYVISGSKALDNVDTLLNAERTAGREYRLKESLESVRKHFDYILLDSPPRLDNITINALSATDYLIIACNADVYSLDGVTDLFQITDSVKAYTNKDLKIAGILLTRYNPRARINKDLKEALEETAQAHGTKVFNTAIRENVAVKEAQALRERLTDYAPRSKANEDYGALTEELLREIKQ